MVSESRSFRPVRFPFSVDALAESIYGTVTAAAVIAAVSEYNVNTAKLAGSSVATVLALSISHGYANWIGMRPSGRAAGDFKRIVEHEWPIVAAALLVALTLIVPRLLGASHVRAVQISLWTCVGVLFGLGFVAARRSGRGMHACAWIGVFDALIGVAIVALKALVH